MNQPANVVNGRRLDIEAPPRLLGREYDWYHPDAIPVRARSASGRVVYWGSDTFGPCNPLAVVGGCALRLGFCCREDCERPCLRRDPRLASNVPDVDTPADWRACDRFIATGTEGDPC